MSSSRRIRFTALFLVLAAVIAVIALKFPQKQTVDAAVLTDIGVFADPNIILSASESSPTEIDIQAGMSVAFRNETTTNYTLYPPVLLSNNNLLSISGGTVIWNDQYTLETFENSVATALVSTSLDSTGDSFTGFLIGHREPFNISFSYGGGGMCYLDANLDIICSGNVTSLDVTYRFSYTPDVNPLNIYLGGYWQNHTIDLTAQLIFPLDFSFIESNIEPTTQLGNVVTWQNSAYSELVINAVLSDWINLNPLQQRYTELVGTNDGAFAHQYLCIAQKSCSEYENSGVNGWAGGFTKYMFDFMLAGQSSGVPISLGPLSLCPWFVSSEICFNLHGIDHFNLELVPGFSTYCGKVNVAQDYAKWDSDHEAFLANGVQACLDEVGATGELTSEAVAEFKVDVPKYARNLRETVQAVCQVYDSYSYTQYVNGKFGAFPVLPPRPLQEDLFSDFLDAQSQLTISVGDDFFLNPGATLQIQITDGSIVIDPSTVEFYLNVEDSIATISNTGLLEIYATSNPFDSTPKVLNITAWDGSKFGIGQFAIVDVDTDGDLMADSYESLVGLDPNIANALEADSDFDGLEDLYEALLSTAPSQRDTDGDGYSDGCEVENFSNPLDQDHIPTVSCNDTIIFLPIVTR